MTFALPVQYSKPVSEGSNCIRKKEIIAVLYTKAFLTPTRFSDNK